MGPTNRYKEAEPAAARSSNAGPELFDAQAAMFERRAGLPDAVCRAIAGKVLEMGAVRPGDLMVEIGPGTGQIGRWFGESVGYIGLDLSAGMLKEFARHLAGDPGKRMLVQADANAGWPLAGRAARAVFGSRALHLLDPDHIASEALRVASSQGATLISGRVERHPDSVRARMAKEMNERLRRRGLAGRRGEGRDRRLVEACCRRGAQLLPAVIVARWPLSSSPRQSLAAWRSIDKLGGIQVPAPVREAVLAVLEAWAAEVFGGLDELAATEEMYVLKGLRIPPAG